MRRGLASGWAVTVMVAAGCATTSARFPTAGELQELAERAPPQRLVRGTLRHIDGWALQGPLPTVAEDAAHPAVTPWERLLAEAAARRGLVFQSEPMSCAAREVGRFFLAQRAMPDHALERYIAARCGSVVANFSTTHWSAELPDSVADDKAFADWRGDVERGLAEALGSGQRSAGIWFGRKDGRAVVMMAHGLRRAVLERTPLVPGPDGKVALRGELLVSASTLQAVINRGRFGYARCEVDASVALPRFSIECAADASDESAWLEIAAFPAGRIIGPMVVNLLVWPRGATRDQYLREGSATARAPGSDVTADIVQLLNEVRREAALPLLALAPGESEKAARLAPHYFAAQAGLEEEMVADKVVLGLRAGWSVGGKVRFGDFTSSAVADLDVSALVGAALASPSGRETLLNPAVRTIAVGPVIAKEEKLLAAVMSTYAFADSTDGESDRVLERLTEVRRRAGRTPPVVIKEMSGHVSAAARAVESGERRPGAALDAALEEFANATSKPVRGWAVEYSTPDELKFPDELVRSPGLRLAIAVARHRPDGEPWTRFVALLLIADEGTTFAALAPRQ